MNKKRELDKLIVEYGGKINVPINRLPNLDNSSDFGIPHLEFSNNLYNYVIVDHADEDESIRKTTSDTDELLYWIFSDISFHIACKYELEIRDPNNTNDFRRIMFDYQLSLLDKLKTKWKTRRENEIIEMLKEYPYRDL